MSESETTHRSGVFVSTGEIYKELMELKTQLTRLRAQISIIAFVVAPVVSTVASTTVLSIFQGA